MPICRTAMFCLLALLSTGVAAQNSSGGVSAAPSPQSAQDPNHGNPQSPAVPIGSTASQNSSDNNGARANPAPGAPTDNNVNGAAGSPASQNNPAAASASDEVLANTEFHAALDTPLSTKTSKPGDRFSATVVDAVRGSRGSIVIPPGSRLEGEVADTDEDGAPAALRGRGALSLRFRDVILPSGQTVPLNATLVSVNNTNGRNTRRTDEEQQIQSGTQGKDTARDMGTGATGGSLVFGAPLKGFAVAAMAGGGHVLTTSGKDVELPAQTGMVIRLNQSIANSY